MRRRLEFGIASRYARVSAVKPLAIATLLIAAGVAAPAVWKIGFDEVYTFAVFSNLRLPDESRGAALDVWRASDSLRRLVYRRIDATSRGPDADIAEQMLTETWPIAHAGLEPARALEAVVLLRTFLVQERDPTVRERLVNNYQVLTFRLDHAALASEGIALRAALEKANPSLASNLLTAYVTVLEQLHDAARMKEAARILRARPADGPASIFDGGLYATIIENLDQEGLSAELAAWQERLGTQPDPVKDSSAFMLYSAAACRPEFAGETKRLARYVREHFDRKAKGLFGVGSEELQVYTRLANCLAPGDAEAEATTLIAQLASEHSADFAKTLFSAYVATIDRLDDPRDLAQAARMLRTYASSNPDDSDTIALAYVSLAARLNEADAVSEAQALSVELGRAQDPLYARSLAVEYAAIAARLKTPAEARTAAVLLRAAMNAPTLPADSVSLGFVDVEADYAAVAPFLSDEDVASEGAQLRQRIERKGAGPVPRVMMAAYGSIAKRMRDAELASAAAFLGARLDDQVEADAAGAGDSASRDPRETFATTWALGEAYAAVAARLDQATARAEADAMLSRFEKAPNVFFAAAWALPCAAVVTRAAVPHQMETLMADLEGRLEMSTWTPAVDRFAAAYGYVAAPAFLHANDERRRPLTRQVVTLAGHPFVSNPDVLLAVLKPASARDFHGDAAAAASWARATYGFLPTDFRPTER
jgi:hypothetical protein